LDKQLSFPFIGANLPDRYWWTKIKVNSLRGNKPLQTLPTKEPATVVLISCSKSKLDKKAAARELYTGQLFKKAVAWAERHGYQWFVISALHGLVTPNQTIAPYDYSLKDRRGSRERQSWAHRTIRGQLTTHVSKASHAILIMPELYRRYIQPELDRESITYTNPLQRLAIGKQMRWLDSN
jgi:uncharacterized protein DUF6884